MSNIKIKNISPETIRNLLNSLFSSNDNNEFSNLIKNFFYAQNENFTPNESELRAYPQKEYVSDYAHLGDFEIDNNQQLPLLIFYLQPGKIINDRQGKKTQYDIIKKWIKQNTQYDSAIALFVSSSRDAFRMSYVYSIYTGNKRTFSHFKRCTFYVAKDITNKTFINRLAQYPIDTQENIKELFSVSKLTKEFYDEIQTWFYEALKHVQFPEDLPVNENPKNATHLIRLITRIIFCWFIKERGIIPEELFDPKSLSEILKEFNNNEKSRYYYNAILQNLFFATLNTPIENRMFAVETNDPQERKKHFGVKNLFRYKNFFKVTENEVLELFKSIPFLNGGLFDCLDFEDLESKKVYYVDGFSRNEKKQAIIPDWLFFHSTEKEVNLTEFGLGKNKKFRGLIDILKSYHFTIDENNPVDEEIALDPELLGHIFENLLASYNPETATTARKASGSYYTPREIVDYMVSESLYYYFLKECPDIDKDKLKKILSYSEEAENLSESEIEKLIDAIFKIKVLDPACGSGAFPMGVLQKLVFILFKIDPKNQYWKQRIISEFFQKNEQASPNNNQKHERENIFVETNEIFENNTDDYFRKLFLIENCIYGVDIQNIAIQISKLRFFISLFIEQPIDRTRYNYGLKPLPNLETKFVVANTLIGLEKPQQASFRNPDIEKLENQLKVLRLRYFTIQSREKKKKIQKEDKSIREKIAELLIKDGWGDVNAKKIADFDPYNQNSSADWFDPEWMFGVKDGFDIVIGNPPYVRQESIIDKDKIIKSVSQTFFDKSGRTFLKIDKRSDLYVYFYYKGLSLLKPNGILCFISSNSWLDVGYGTNLQEFLLKKVKPLMIVDNIAERSFEAGINTVIVLIQRPKNGVSDNDLIKFIALKKPFSEILGSDVLKQIREGKERTINEDFRLIPKTRKELWVEGIETENDEVKENNLWKYNYIGNKWGGKYLRAPEIFFKILEKPQICKLQDIATIKGGIITGSNKKYYRQINHPILNGYEPCWKSPKEIKKIKVSQNDAISMIQNSNIPYTIKRATLLWPDLRNDIHVIHFNEDYLAFEHNFYGLEPINPKDNLKLCILLNSTLSAFVFEILTRTGLGGGAGRLVKLDIKRFIILNTNFFEIEKFQNLKSFESREIKSIFEELGFQKCTQRNCKHPDHPYEYVKPEEVSFDRIMPDRKELDKIIFEALGLTEKEQLEVYRAVLELVKNRLLKAKSR